VEDYRIKISVLWLFVALAVVSAGMLAIIEPGGIANLTAGQLEGEQLSPAWLLFLAVFVLVPLVMAFLSLTLKASVNRWAHVIVGTIFAILRLPKLVQAIQGLYAAATLMKLAGIVALALIVWYAWTS